MYHTAIVHKELDAILDVAQEKDDVDESFRSWMELKNCVVCNDLLPTTGESAKRLHYLGHFQTDLEARINSETQKILKKPAPYVCQEPNCKYTTETMIKATQPSLKQLTLNEPEKTNVKPIMGLQLCNFV